MNLERSRAEGSVNVTRLVQRRRRCALLQAIRLLKREFLPVPRCVRIWAAVWLPFVRRAERPNL